MCGATSFFGAKLTYVYILEEYVHKHIYTYIHTCIYIIIIYIHTIFPVFSFSSGCECAERRTFRSEIAIRYHPDRVHNVNNFVSFCGSERRRWGRWVNPSTFRRIQNRVEARFWVNSG